MTNDFRVINPLYGAMTPWGVDDGDDLVKQARRGRLIQMSEQQIRTAERENQQAYFANGMLLGADRNQYF